MADPFTTTFEGQNMILYHEGFSADPYFDFSQFSIGFGSGIDLEGNPVTASTPPINRRQAETLFSDVTLPIYEAGVANSVVRNDLPVEALSALTSFAYNLGVSALNGSSLLARIESGLWGDVAYQWGRWIFAGGIQRQSLLRRRFQEYCMFKDSVIAASIAVESQFSHTIAFDSGTNNETPITFTGECGIFDEDARQDFFTISSRRALAGADRSDWQLNEAFDTQGNVISTNPGIFYPNLPTSDQSAAADTSTEAANQGVVPPVVGTDDRRLQPPLVAAGMPVATILTPAGTRFIPSTTPVNQGSMVLVGGVPIALAGDLHDNSPASPDAKVPSHPTVLFGNSVQIAATLDQCQPGGLVGPGEATVITGIGPPPT